MAEYTDARLEGLLSAAINRSVPDLREEAATATVSPLAAPDGVVPVQASRRSPALRRTVMGLAACLVLVLGLSSFAFFRPQSVIGIDVNPSIELTANYFDRVLSVKPLNEDAVTIIGDMDLKYVDLDIAMNALVGSMALHGYFESGQDVAVLVSVSGGSADHNLTLQKKLAVDIEAAASAAGASASVYTQNTGAASPVSPDSSAGDGVSSGKQVFIDKLLTLDPTLNAGELAAMPIGEIAGLVRQRGLDLSSIVDYDSDDSVKENIEDFIDDLDDPDDEDDNTPDDDDDDDNDDDDHDSNYDDEDDD